MNSADQQMIDDYSPDYCHFLELAYGKNWMSEGGEVAAEKFCSGIELAGKRILDVGSGLGGLVFYLAAHAVRHGRPKAGADSPR